MLFVLMPTFKAVYQRNFILVFLFVYSIGFKTFSQTNNNYPDASNLNFNQGLTQIDSLILKENFDLALTNIEELQTSPNYKPTKDSKLLLELRKAQIFFGNNEEQKAMDLLLSGLDEASRQGLTAIKIDYYKYLGKVFRDSKNYDRSLRYYRSALESSGRIKDTLNSLDAFLKMGVVFYSMEKYDSAIYYNRRIFDYGENEKTAEFHVKSYNNLAVIALEMDSLTTAELYGTKVLEIKKNQKDTLGIVYALLTLGGIKYNNENYSESEQIYMEALTLVSKLKSETAEDLKSSVLYNLAYTNEKLKNFKAAYFYHEKANNLADSIAEVNRIENIAESEAKYNYEKQVQIAKEEKLVRERAQLMFYGAAFALLSFLVLGYIFYRNYRLKQQNKMEQVENETQTKIINATVDAKEKERKAIAETLHDSVSALLSSANLHLQATKAQLKEKAPQEITKAQTIVNEASVKIRDLSHELISSILLKFGLAFAIHDMCQKYSNSEITLHSDDDGVKRYDTDFEIKIHNIVEELVNNILKHSKASNATIMLAHRENDMLSVRVSDDGVGFDPKRVRGKDGLGLSHIEARIKVMKGVFNIISSKNNGTNIFISVPIKFKEKIA